MNHSTQTPETVNPLAIIISEANAAGRHIARTTVFENERGKLIIRADQRGYLLAEVWKRNEGPSHRLTIAFWQFQDGGSWVLSTSQVRAEEWMAEAAEILGEQVFPSENPQPIDPIDQAAADFVAQAGTDYDGRVSRAVELVKAGQVTFPKYNTRFIPAGATGHYECDCPDSCHRQLRSFFGTVCKHSVAMLLASYLRQEAEQVTHRRLIDRIEMANARRQRQAVVPAYACRPGRMEDFLG